MNEIGQAVMDILDQLVDKVLGGQPVRTDGKPVNQVVYSQMRIGRPIDVREFADPWSPSGGATLQAEVPAGTTPTTVAPVTPAVAAGAAPATPAAPPPPAKPQPDPRFRRAIDAAFNTTLLVDELLEVTNDGTYQPFPTGRSLSVMWNAIIHGMQPKATAPPAPDVQQRIDEANKVLYVTDADGQITGKTPAFRSYQNNSLAFAQAKKDYNDAQTAAMADPVKAEAWPQDSVFYQAKVDNAWDDFKTEGADKVEAALDVIQSVGRSVQAHMIAQAIKLFDAWNLGIAGVPSPVAYARISPTTWYDHRDKEIGFTRLEVTQEKASSFNSTHTDRFSHNFSSSESSSVGGGATVPIPWVPGLSIGGSGSHSEAATHGDGQGDESRTYQFHSDAKNVTIDLEWGLCTIERPWLLSDLFHMENWYLVGGRKDCISTGTIEGQEHDEHHLMPSIPLQFLVVRDVRIHADSWGSDSDTLHKAHDDWRADTEQHADSQSGGVNFLCFGGSASHSSSEQHADSASSGSTDDSSEWSWDFDGNTLSISGTQIVGWISEIVPSCPAEDDPQLPAEQH